MLLFIYSICLYGQSVKLDLRRYGLMLKRILEPSRLSKSTESSLLYSRYIKSTVSLVVKGRDIRDHMTSSLPSLEDTRDRSRLWGGG